MSLHYPHTFKIKISGDTVSLLIDDKKIYSYEGVNLEEYQLIMGNTKSWIKYDWVKVKY